MIKLTLRRGAIRRAIVITAPPFPALGDSCNDRNGKPWKVVGAQEADESTPFLKLPHATAVPLYTGSAVQSIAQDHFQSKGAQGEKR